jgi:hypothetical protein
MSRETGELLEQLERLFAAIAEEVQQNPNFASRIGNAIRGLEDAFVSHRLAKPRSHGVLNPYKIYETGWESLLREKLEPLQADQLKDVIAEHRLDPSGRAPKKREALVEFIVARVIALSRKGRGR